MSQLMYQIGEYKAPDNIINYLERFELALLINEVKEEKSKVGLLLSLIGVDSYNVLRNLVSPENPSSKTFKELSSLLIAHYSPPKPQIAERFKFYNSNQGDASIAQFVSKLKRLAKNCNFGPFRDEALRDKFICGLKDVNIQKKLLCESQIDFCQAVNLATAMASETTDSASEHIAEQSTATVGSVLEMHAQNKSQIDVLAMAKGLPSSQLLQQVHQQANCQPLPEQLPFTNHAALPNSLSSFPYTAAAISQPSTRIPVPPPPLLDMSYLELQKQQLPPPHLQPQRQVPESLQNAALFDSPIYVTTRDTAPPIANKNANSTTQAATTSTSEVDNFSFESSVQSLVHACQCRDAHCHLPNCQKMKRIMQHTRGCCRRNVCQVCQQLITLCYYHEKNCHKQKCSVLFCWSIKRKRKQHQQHQQRLQSIFQRERIQTSASPELDSHNGSRSALEADMFRIGGSSSTFSGPQFSGSPNMTLSVNSHFNLQPGGVMDIGTQSPATYSNFLEVQQEQQIRFQELQQTFMHLQHQLPQQPPSAH